MEIAGYSINWDGIIDRARQEARNIIREADRGSYRLSYREITEDFIFWTMEKTVWNNLLKELSSYSATETSAEKVVAAIMRKGIGKDRITFRKNSFKFTLKNRAFKVYRQEDGFSSVPIVPGKSSYQHPCQVNNFDPELFAELVFAYDEMAPEVEEAFKEILEEFRAMELRKKQERTAREMTQKTIDILIKEFIEPLGLQCRFEVSGDIVRLDLEQRKKATLDIPVAELSSRLKDSRAILESLKTVPAEKELSFFTKYSRIEF